MPSKQALDLIAKDQDRLAELDAIISAAQNEKQKIKRNTSVPCGTLEALLNPFISYIEVERGFSEHTVVAYRKNCRAFLDIFKLSVWLDRFLETRKLSPSIERNCEWFLRFLRKDRSFNIDQPHPGTKEITAFLDILDKAGREKKQALLTEKEIPEFLNDIKDKGLNATIRGTRKILEALVKTDFGETQRLPDERDVIDFTSQLRKDGLADSSVENYFGAVRTFFKFLVREGVFGEDHSAELPFPRKGKYLPIVLGEEQVIQVLEAGAKVKPPPRYPKRNRAMLETIYASGLRVSEVCKLRKEDVRPDLRIIKCKGKGGRERIVPTSKRCLAAIAAYCEDERPKLENEKSKGLLFLSRGGRKLGREVFFRIIRKYGKFAGLGLSRELHPHVLRHSFATHLLRGGADLRFVQDILGHNSVNTTEIYLLVEKSKLKNVHKKFHPRG